MAESTFQTVPVLIAGPSYKDKSRPLASQETHNFYHELIEAGKEKYVIKSFHGQKLLNLAPAGFDRGQHRMKEVAYRVIGSVLYQVSNAGVHTSKGVISGTERCIFADDGVSMFVVADGVVSEYRSDTDAVTVVTDISIVGAQSVTFINNQFAYTFPNLTVFSDVGNGASASSLNAVGAESSPDDLVRDYTFSQILYRFGKRSCESWYNSGVGIPPFDRIEGQIINVGLAAIHSINNTADFIYWLGDDMQVYRARGGQEQVVSTAFLSGEIQSYATVSDAFTEVFTLDNKNIIMITFPSANKTWCLSEELELNGWFELSEGLTTGRYNAGSVLECYGKILVGDQYTGGLYELDKDTYDQAGEPWQRRRVISSIDGNMLRAKGKRIQMSRFELILEKGVGLISGQGEDPKIMIEASYDGGKSWDTGTWMRTGRLGETNIRAEWCSMKSFYDMIVRITTSDPVSYTIYAGTIDLRLAGR